MSEFEAEELLAAESLYADWRRDRGAGGTSPFEALCDGHPSLAPALRALHEGYRGIGQVLGLDSSLEGDGAADGGARPFADLIERLASRRAAAERYRAGSSLGEGGMGSVQAVLDPDLRRAMAKKTVRSADGAGRADQLDPRLLGQFIQEAQITAQLSHPGVVPVHELGLDEAGRIYYTMAQVQGRTLDEVFERVQGGDPDWTLTRVVGVLQRVCETLSYAHSRGVIHRDLKPANVMVGSFGEVYVMDWGLAKVGVGAAPAAARSATPLPAAAVTTDRREASERATFADLRTQAGSVAGTPGYMAPEQARGEVEELDARTDVYAVGAMLYKLLSGLVPCEAELSAYYRARRQAEAEGAPERALPAFRALLAALAAGRVEPLARVAPAAPAELVSIAGRALATAPAERYPDAGALGADLRAWLEGRVVSAHESGPWAELRKWVGRNRALASSLLGGVLVLLAGASGMYLLELRARGRVESEQQRTLAEQARTLRLSDTQVLAQLVAEEPDLWPAVPDTLPVLDDWLGRARGLVGRRAQHEEDLAYLLAHAPRHPEEGRRPRFLRQEDDWQHDVLVKLLAGLSELEPELERIAERRAAAASLAERTLSGPIARTRWAAARASVAALPIYGGLELAPQLGLLPLRQDPDSGLWEFWHVLSGAEPTLDPDTGRWRVEEETGVVLVLIPGGTYLVGTRDVPDGHPFSDQYKQHDRSGVLNHSVRLDPYLVSKYELTQGQWRRTRGANPSQGRQGPETHPADSASWDEAMETLRRLDLTLPTEAQWEVAARAGADTRFYAGPLWDSLIGHAVLFPDSAGDYEPDEDELGDILPVYGHPWRNHHEPVGGRLPNAFGLHDVHGNVWEWCLDLFDRSAPPRPGDGLRQPDEDTTLRVVRGGAYSSSWPNARLTYRYAWDKQNSEPDVGLRPARSLR